MVSPVRGKFLNCLGTFLGRGRPFEAIFTETIRGYIFSSSTCGCTDRLFFVVVVAIIFEEGPPRQVGMLEVGGRSDGQVGDRSDVLRKDSGQVSV